MLPVSKKICNPVQHLRWKLIIRKLSRKSKNGMVDKTEYFPKVEEHHAHCSTVAVSILAQLWNMLVRAWSLLEFRTDPYWFWSIFVKTAGLM